MRSQLKQFATLATLGIVFGLSAGAYADDTIADGNWNDPAIWDGTEVPGKGTFARVNHDVTVAAYTERGQNSVINNGASLTINSGVEFFQEFNQVRLNNAAATTVNGTLTARKFYIAEFNTILHLAGPAFTVVNVDLQIAGGNTTIHIDNSEGNVTSFQVPEINDSFSGNNKNKWIWDGDDGNPIIPVDVTGDITKADRWDLTVNFNDLDPSDPTTLITYGGALNDTGGFTVTVTGSEDVWAVDTSVAGEIQIKTVPPVEVPDVEGQSETDATNALTAEGFTVNVERETTDFFPVDEVFGQDPDGGEFAPSGSEVTILVSDGLPTGLDWTGATDSQFDLGGNWVGVGDVEPEGEWPPDVSERLRINNGDNVAYSGANLASITARRLVVSNNSALDITGGSITLDTTLDIGTPTEDPGTVTMTGGTLDVTDGFAIRVGQAIGSIEAAGAGTFIVGGDANILTDNFLLSTTTTVGETEIGGTARLEVHGSNATIDVWREFTMATTGTISLAFVADADGFSTIEVSTNPFTPRLLQLNGTVEIDFDGHQAALESGVETERVFTLITHKGNFSDENDVLAATNATLPAGWTIANDTTENAIKLTFDAAANVGDWMRFD